MATLSRQHNDSNVLILGARTTTIETAVACMQAFLKVNFEGGRHEKRVAKLGGLSC
jgi:ribose 5-phosphate isomerase B